MIKSMTVRWVVHVAWMGKRRGACRDLVGKPKEKGRIIFKWILKKKYGKFWTVLIELRTGQMVSSCKLGDHKYICCGSNLFVSQTSQTWQLCRILKLF